MAEEIAAILADPARLQELTKQIFDQVDTDGSNRIEKGELKHALVTVATEANLPIPTDEKIDSTFIALDTDRSGSIDVSEFSVLVKALLQSLL